MKSMLLRGALLAAVTVAVAAAPASAGTSVVAAADLAGNTTTCTIKVTQKDWSFSDRYDFSGSTTCSVAVQQSCRVSFADVTGWPQDVFGTTCSVSGATNGEFSGSVVYDAAITAPGGQLWLAAPAGCAGLATQTLTCRLTAGSVAGLST